MKIVGIYSFSGGREIIEAQFAVELREVERVIAAIDSEKHKTKTSREKTMPGRKLYSPRALNKAFKAKFEELEWHTYRIACEYPTEYYVGDYRLDNSFSGAFREMDFVKNRVGVEVQFGKYAFMVYNVCAKMTIFHKLGVIDVGIEVVPVKEFADEMSTGVSYFEQFVWDLEQRGVSDIDIPVLVLGINHR
ncbi:MAG: restriction endonuclease [Chloroflexi bacterium]|nr:restriction endonuclease [Anaerolineae bacterium]RLC69932.1 MAG: restriction endonuclease [Chloroflexota bacterium]